MTELIDLPYTGIGITVRIDSLQRIANLDCVLRHLFYHFKVTVYIIESDSCQKLTGLLGYWKGKLQDGQTIKYVFDQDDGPFFHNTRLKNILVKVANQDGIRFYAHHDSDVILPFTSYEWSVHRLREDDSVGAVFPYAYYCFVPESPSELIRYSNCCCNSMENLMTKDWYSEVTTNSVLYSVGGCIF